MKAMRLPGYPTCRPEEVGLDSSSLETHRAANQRQLRMGLLSGVAECVLKDNKVAYVDIQGYQDKELGIPMTEKSVQRCYSITKPITAFGLLLLWEEGKLHLDDPVAKFIPEFKHMKVLTKKEAIGPGVRGGGLVDAKRLITLRHMVTHTSGLAYGPDRNDRTEKLKVSTNPIKQQYLKFVQQVDAGDIPNLEAYCKELAKQPLRFEPGERWQYSYGMEVIGRVIEVVSGRPLDRFMKERVFEPIGMRDIDFFLSPQKARRQLAAIYKTRKQGRRYHTLRFDGTRPEESGWCVAGMAAKIFSGGGFAGSCDGGTVCSLRDLALFCSMIANKGYSHATQTQVLQPATIRHGCKNWLTLKSVTQRSSLRGWHDCKGCEKLGWAPFGITEGDCIFMAGIGYWSVNLRTGALLVSFPNSSWDNFGSVPGWKADEDELEAALKKATEVGTDMKKRRKSVQADSSQPSKKRKKG